jgi:hypothetical protein
LEESMRRLTQAEIDEIAYGTLDLAVLDAARSWTDRNGTWKPHRGTYGRSRKLAKAGLLKEAGTCAMPPHVLYVITAAGRAALTPTETTS